VVVSYIERRRVEGVTRQGQHERERQNNSQRYRKEEIFDLVLASGVTQKEKAL